MLHRHTYLAFLLILAGTGLSVLSVTADLIGASSSGFSRKQMALALTGIIAIAMGVVLLTPIGQRYLGRWWATLIAAEKASQSTSGRTVKLMVIALWFGLVSGLLEGIGFEVLQRLHFTGRFSIEFLWVTPLFNALLFGVIGLAFVAVDRLLPGRLPITLLAVFSFILLTTFGLEPLPFPKLIHPIAIIPLQLGIAIALTQLLYRRLDRSIRFWRRTLPWVTALVALTMIGIQGSLWLKERSAIAHLPPAPSDAPNVLFIVIDTLRADHLSSYGYERLTSPNLDNLAEQGVLFENAFATSSWALPSHASLFTGLYNHEHNVSWKNAHGLTHTPQPTLPEVMQQRGYRTAGFSGNLFWITKGHGFGRGLIRLEDYFYPSLEIVLYTNLGGRLRKLGLDDILNHMDINGSPSRKWASEINRSVLGWLERDRDKPFFVFINYFDVHDPYKPPQPYRSRFSDMENPGGILDGNIGGEDPDLTPEQLQSEMDAYDGSIAYLDQQINSLITEIQNRGMGDNLLVVITSDHGEAFGEHKLLRHGHSLYREEIYVPLIMWQPGKIPAGVRISQPVTTES
jgi:hypothetical protein